LGPYVERVRRSGLAPRKCFRLPRRRAADIDVCRKPIAAGAVLVLDAARSSLEIDRHYSGTL
jgi:hypothetical protein